MRRLALLLFLVASVASAQPAPMTPLRIAVIQSDSAPSTTPGACKLMLSPAVFVKSSGCTWYCAGTDPTAAYTLATCGGTLADGAVTPDKVLLAGQTDEFCLTYELTGDTWQWQACGSGSVPTSTGFRHVTAGAEDGASKLVDTADMNDAQVTLAKMANLAQDQFIGRTTASTGVPQTTTISAAGRALIDDADATAQRATLGLGTLATQSGTFSGTSSGTNTGDETAAGVLAKLVTVDGAASGLDADLLDGVDSATFLTRDTTAQTILQKTLTMTATGTSWLFKSASAVTRIVLGPFNTRDMSFYNSSGTERSYFDTAGVLQLYDTGSATTDLAANRSSSPTWTGVHTFSNAAGPKFGPGTDTDFTVFNIDQGTGTDPSGSWEDSAERLKFGGMSLAFDTPSLTVSRGLQWSVTSPVTSKLFANTCGLDFNGNRDNVYNVSYNVDCYGTRVTAGEHAFQMQLESSFDALVTAGRQDYLEWNWNYFGLAGYCVNGTNNGTTCTVNGDCTGGGTCDYGWRPFGFAVEVLGNTSHGAATYFWKTSSNNGNTTYGLELTPSHVAFNRDSAFDSPDDSGLSSFVHLRDFSPMAFYGTKTKLMFDQTSSWAAQTTFSNGVQWDFSPTSKASGYIVGFGMLTPTAPGAGSTVAGTIPFYLQDMRQDLNQAGFSYIFRADSQTCGATGARCNISMGGTGYNHGHYENGSTHWWEETPGRLRLKSGAPTSDTDGNAIASGTGSNGFGLSYWADPANLATDTGNFVCTSAGQTCVDVKSVAGVDSDCTTTQGAIFYAWCK